jgi:Domain of Unknown Function with PDB structure (DUF3857)/Transglutaminase-like superfamily
MRNSSKAGLAAIVILIILTPAAWAGVSVPDWVRTAAAAPLPQYEPDTDAVVLLDDVNYTVANSGDYVEHYRRAVKILRPEGRDEANFYLHLREKEKVLSLHAWSIDKSGREYELKDRDFAERGAFDFALYNDIRMRTATAPAADPGAVVAFEFEIRRVSWLNHLDWGFQEPIPVHEARLALQLPQGWEYRPYWAGTLQVPPDEKPGNVTWVLHDLPAIKHEPMSPARWSLSARLGLAYLEPGQSAKNMATWEALGTWFDQLATGRRNPSPELSEKARQLTAGKADFDGKVRALTDFMQSEIRYVAIEIGIGGYQPHPATDVFRVRYGDCKDKATLLSSMLHEVGIESDYIVINTHRGIAHPDIPTPAAFNHVILAIDLPPGTKSDPYRSIFTAKSGKRYLIFDPTDPYTPLGELRGDLQDSYALLVADGKGELIHTPLFTPDANVLARTGHFTLSPEGVLVGDVVEDRTGDHALQTRAELIHSNAQERAQKIERGLSRSLQGFTLEKTDIRGLDHNQQTLVISLKLNQPGYGQVRGPLMLVRPRVLGEKSFALEKKPRHYPFQFDEASRETDTFEIDLPKDYVVDDVPDPVKVDAGFASYESKIVVEGSKLRYWREFVRRDVLVGPERTEDLRKFLATIGGDEAAVVVLKRAQ